MILGDTFSIVPLAKEVRGSRLTIIEKNLYMRWKLEEQIVQKFSYRCPYCDHTITYNDLHLKHGENKVKCPSCKKIYIKIVPGSLKKRKKK